MPLTEPTFYDELAGRCASIMDSLGQTGGAYIVDEDYSTITAQQSVVQILPQGGSLVYAESGAGLYRVRFSTILWWRNNLDYADRANERLIGATGAIVAATALRFGVTGPPAIPGLVGTFMLDEAEALVEPILANSMGGPRKVEGMAGWTRIRDEWQAAFDFTWTTTGG